MMEKAEMIVRMERPMKTADVARYLGQSPRNILRMVHNGQIPAKQIGAQWYYSPRKIAELAGMLDEG